MLKNYMENDSCESKDVIFWKSALNLVLIADSESTPKSVQTRTGIIDLQNDFIILVAKQWKNIISVPMSFRFGNDKRSSRRGLLGG